MKDGRWEMRARKGFVLFVIVLIIIIEEIEHEHD